MTLAKGLKLYPTWGALEAHRAVILDWFHAGTSRRAIARRLGVSASGVNHFIRRHVTGRVA